MAEFNIRVNDLKNDAGRPVMDTIILLKTLIEDEAVINDLDLALTEAVANVMRHAYPDGATGPLSIRIRTTPGKQVEITITDFGQGLDPVAGEADMPGPEAESGRGIPLMTNLCDRVDFNCRGNANSVILTKNVSPPSWRSE